MPEAFIVSDKGARSRLPNIHFQQRTRFRPAIIVRKDCSWGFRVLLRIPLAIYLDMSPNCIH